MKNDISLNSNNNENNLFRYLIYIYKFNKSAQEKGKRGAKYFQQSAILVYAKSATRRERNKKA